MTFAGNTLTNSVTIQGSVLKRDEFSFARKENSINSYGVQNFFCYHIIIVFSGQCENTRDPD